MSRVLSSIARSSVPAVLGALTALIFAEVWRPISNPRDEAPPSEIGIAAGASRGTEPASPPETISAGTIVPHTTHVDAMSPSDQYETRDPGADEARRSAVLADFLTAHLASTRDPAWADRASLSLSNDLEQVAETTGTTLLSVDCRRNSCVANLRWTDYASARRTYAQLLTWRYELNCARTIHIPAPLVQTAEYEAQLLFDCSEQVLEPTPI